MRYKGINLRDLADKIPATDAKDGFGRLQAQPDIAPKAPDHKSTRGVENVFLAAAHGDKAVAMALLNSLQRRMGKSNTETTEATISDRLAAFLRLLGDDPTSEAGTLYTSWASEWDKVPKPGVKTSGSQLSQDSSFESGSDYASEGSEF